MKKLEEDLEDCRKAADMGELKPYPEDNVSSYIFYNALDHNLSMTYLYPLWISVFMISQLAKYVGVVQDLFTP